MRPMHEVAIINPMAHERSSQPRLSPSSYEEDIRAVLAPRLAHFEAVARHEHVTRAAQELGVPQSTLSRAMVRLEQDLGVALFARKGRTVSLTPAGRTFLGSAERALAEVEKAADSVRADADPATGKVAFGFLHTMGSETVPALLRAFRADHPRVRFQLVQNYGEAMIERLRAAWASTSASPHPSPTPPTSSPAAWTNSACASSSPRTTASPPAAVSASRRPPTKSSSPSNRVTACGGSPTTCAPRRASHPGSPSRARRRRPCAAWSRPALGVALLPPPAVARPGVVELTVTAPRAAREIGVAWLDGHPDTPPVAAFKRFLLSRRGHLLPD